MRHHILGYGFMIGTNSPNLLPIQKGTQEKQHSKVAPPKTTQLQLTERLRPPDLQLDLVLHELAQPRDVLLVHQPRVRRHKLQFKIMYFIRGCMRN